MTEKNKSIATSDKNNLRSIIVDKKATSDEHVLNSKVNKLKKQHALLLASVETEIEELEEKFITNCSDKDFNLDTLIDIRDEIDLLERRRKVASEIYAQLTEQ